MNIVYVDGTYVRWCDSYTEIRKLCKSYKSQKIACWFLESSVLRLERAEYYLSAYTLKFIEVRQQYCEECSKYLDGYVVVEALFPDSYSERINLEPVENLEFGLEVIATIDQRFEKVVDAVRLGLL